MAKLRKLLVEHTERLEKAGVDSPRLSAEVLLAHAMGVSRNDFVKTLLIAPDTVIADDAARMAEASIRRRESCEPVAYITGVKEFYGREFAVSPATLVPRPDTETLVEAALSFAATRPATNPAFIDLGAGSGAIGITVALELPAWTGIAVDISEDALIMAERNAKTLGAGNIDFAVCDFLGDKLPQGPFDMILANPPYVSEREYASLSREVALFEPKSALVPLFAGSNGLEYLYAIMELAERILKPEGLLLMEMGCTQGNALLKKAAGSDVWAAFSLVPDLAGRPRVFRAVRRAGL